MTPQFLGYSAICALLAVCGLVGNWALNKQEREERRRKKQD